MEGKNTQSKLLFNIKFPQLHRFKKCPSISVEPNELLLFVTLVKNQ
jgi:hypothetical protein